MPELPEVEQYRQILLPLVPSKAEGKKKEPIAVALTTPSGSKPPKKWLTPEDVETLSPTKNGCENVAVAGGGGGYFCCDVKRRGKLICLVLRSIAAATAAEKEGESNTTTAATDKYLFLHFGMTGRISSPDRIIRLESVKDDDDGSGEDTAAAVAFPPPHCHMTISAGSYKTAFTDRRKFGSAQLLDDASPFDDLAPDALSSLSSASSSSSPASSNAGEGTEASIAASAEKDGGADAVESIVAKMAGQSTGIKAMLLDQKRLLSGVGNWVADEVLYQCFIHPDQAYLTSEEARNLLEKLGSILAEAVERLKQGKEFPDSWLFGYRWTKKKSGSKDSQGRPLTFVTAGGRTSAIVASIQKLRKRQPVKNSTGSSSSEKGSTRPAKAKKNVTNKTKRKTEEEEEEEEADHTSQKKRPREQEDAVGTKVPPHHKSSVSRRKSPRFA